MRNRYRVIVSPEQYVVALGEGKGQDGVGAPADSVNASVYVDD